ncbi:unnamed protein product [Phytomonas sp. Hart1]|nr:unnamed protein product [Phytomonas sp. Hart1]|eukprot:CCW72107.1 unnamed protein product [Phytomonas sp. isolate Hart1]
MPFSVSYMLTAIIVITWLICQIYSLDDVAYYLILMPMQLHAWAMILYVTVEPNLLIALFSIVILLKYGIRLERVMRNRVVYSIYLMLSALFTASALLVINIMLSAICKRNHRMYYGPWPVLEAVLIAQCNNDGFSTIGLQKSSYGGVVNDDKVYNLDTGRRESVHVKWSLRGNKIRVQYLPQSVVLLALINDITSAMLSGWGSAVQTNDDATNAIPQHTHGSSTLSSICSMWIIWVYLRYVRHQINFPLDVLVYPVSLRRMVWRLGNLCSHVTHLIYSALWSTTGNDKMENVLPTVNYENISTDNLTLLPGSTVEEAERRRASALAALSRRLQQMRVSSNEINDVL